MSAKKNKPKPQTVTAEIDYDKLAHAIASALIEADSIREAQKEEEEKHKKEQLRKILGEKEYPQKAKLRKAHNEFVMFWNLLFLSEKNAEYLSGATIFAQFLLEAIFSACKSALYFVDFLAVVFIIYSFVIGKPLYSALFLLLFLVSFMYARYFRLAIFEVQHMKDRNYMISFLSAIASFFAMLFALIGLIGGIIHGA